MKFVRVLLWCVAAIAVLLVIVVGVALNSSFQTWAARKALARQPDLRGSIARVDAGLNRVQLKDARIETHGAVLTLPALDAELPLSSAALGHGVLVRKLVAHGWTLDLLHAPRTAQAWRLNFAGWMRSAPAQAELVREFSLLPSAYAAMATPVPAAFAGLSQVVLPVDLALDGVDLEGDVILPGQPSQPVMRLKVRVHGGGLAAGKEGRFTVDVTGATGDGGAVSLTSAIAATMDTPRTFTRLSAKGEAGVSGTKIPQGVKLSFDVSGVRAAGHETYSVGLSNAQPLLAARAELDSTTGRINGTWTANLRASDLAPFALGHVLPAFAANGTGTFATDLNFAEMHAVGQLRGSVDQLGVLLPELTAIGAVQFDVDFEVLQHADSIRVERLNLAAASAAKKIASIRALQAFEFNPKTRELSVADQTQDLLAVSLEGVPLAWAKPVLGDIEVTGEELKGEFAAAAHAGGLTLRAKSPLTAGHVSVSQGGKPMLNDVSISLSLSADYSPSGWQANIAQFTAQTGNATVLSLTAKAGQLAGANQPVKATGSWTASLPALLAQPVVTGTAVLASGAAKGDFDASIDSKKAVQAKITLSDLVAVTKEKLPTTTIDAHAEADANNTTTFNVGLVFDQAGRKSDLTLSGTAGSAAGATALQARATSELIVVEDVQLLLLPLAASPAPAAQPATTPGRDAAAFWGAITGDFALALKKVVSANAFTVTNVAGAVKVDPAALKFDNVSAEFGQGSNLKVSGGFTFDAKKDAPYALLTDLTVNNFDTGPAFRALNPDKPPTLEAKVNVTAHVIANGINLTDVADHAQGDFQLTSKSGIFRALSADVSDKVQKTQATVAALGGILGAVTGRKEYGDYANKSQILSDIAKALAEIPFDQLNVQAKRDSTLNIKLTDFTLISPEVRLLGTGSVTYQEKVPLLGQPLSLQLTLSARGKTGDLMKRAGLLDTKQDNLGYTAFAMPIKIGGTLSNPDTRELRNALLNSALEKSGLLNGLIK